MRHILLAVLAAALLASAGCGPTKPMTQKEFKGFCYQFGEGRAASCDAIAVCDPYLTVLNATHASLQQCLDDCAAVYAPQAWQYAHTNCAGPAQTARDWCQRYCRTAYQK